MATLTKRDIVVKISNDTGMVQHAVLEVVQRTLDLMTESLARGETVELRNFGVLEVKLTKPRVGRNPNQPGSRFLIPARATVKFKPGKVMRQRVDSLTDAMIQDEGASSNGASHREPVASLNGVSAS
jgi:nucleoid DNA-binding protein